VKRLAAKAAALPPGPQDLILAIVLVIVDVATLLPYRSQLHPAGVAVALLVAQNVPLAWRRRWPLAALLVIGAARISYDLIGLQYAPLPLGPAIGYFTVMSQCSLRVRQVVSALVLAAIVTSQAVPGHNEPYDFAAAALIFVAAGAAGALSRAYVNAVRARAASAEAQHDLEIAAAAARERSRIARELHDVVAHHVSLMAVQAEATASLLPDHPAAALKSADVIADSARQALTELRRLLGVLRGPDERAQTAPSPSLGDIESVLDQVRRTGLRVDLHVQGAPGPLAPGVDLTAYRIVQEALTNTVRHSPADHADVTVCYEPGFITVSIADSGPADAAVAADADGRADAARRAGADGRADAARRAGAASAESADQIAAAAGRFGSGSAGGGLGLAGITERVASCGGNLTIGPTRSGGFLVTARLPAQ
jgi:signal transduction histidine kinase